MQLLSISGVQKKLLGGVLFVELVNPDEMCRP